MTGWMLIVVGLLTMAVITAYVWHWTSNDDEYLEEYSRRQVRRELNDIELHRPEHLLEHHERPERH